MVWGLGRIEIYHWEPEILDMEGRENSPEMERIHIDIEMKLG